MGGFLEAQDSGGVYIPGLDLDVVSRHRGMDVLPVTDIDTDMS